jgi:hypothetical protein
MKKLVWLLIFVNLGLLVYFNLDLILPSTTKTAALEINPEKIKVLTPQQIEALPKKVIEIATTPMLTPALNVDGSVALTSTPSTPTPQTSSCYEWGIFSTARVGDAQTASASISQALVKEHTSSEAKRFWVYKPPLKSPEAAQAKAAELKALGVEELFIVQDAKWKNAISFGVFEDEQLATNLVAELKSKGVKEVVKALRNQGKGHASLLFKEITSEKVFELKKLKSDFPEADLKEVSCN